MISSKVIKVIEELTKRVENNLVVFGHCFTEEGRAYWKENSIVFLETDFFHWTDERYIEIHHHHR